MSSNDFILGQVYAQTIQIQQDVPLAGLDPGLKATITTYQTRMKQQARYFNDNLVGGAYGFIAELSTAFNLCALANATITLEYDDILAAPTNDPARNSAATTYGSTADQIGAAEVGASTLTTKTINLKQTQDQFLTSYEAALAAVTATLQASVKDILAEIDGLKTAINKNIEDIVGGANEVGGSVTTLIMGIITTIDSAEKDPVKDTKKKTEDGKKAALDTSFAVTAIGAAAKGGEKMSQAGADLNANNEKLAAAYQAVAAVSSSLAVAQVVAVQTTFFADALNAAAASSNDAPVALSGVQSGFTSFSNAISALGGNAEDAKAMAAESQAASPQWTALAAELKVIKTEVIALGNLAAS